MLHGAIIGEASMNESGQASRFLLVDVIVKKMAVRDVGFD